MSSFSFGYFILCLNIFGPASMTYRYFKKEKDNIFPPLWLVILLWILLVCFSPDGSFVKSLSNSIADMQLVTEIPITILDLSPTKSWKLIFIYFLSLIAQGICKSFLLAEFIGLSHGLVFLKLLMMRRSIYLVTIASVIFSSSWSIYLMISCLSMRRSSLYGALRCDEGNIPLGLMYSALGKVYIHPSIHYSLTYHSIWHSILAMYITFPYTHREHFSNGIEQEMDLPHYLCKSTDVCAIISIWNTTTKSAFYRPLIPLCLQASAESRALRNSGVEGMCMCFLTHFNKTAASDSHQVIDLVIELEWCVFVPGFTQSQ